MTTDILFNQKNHLGIITLNRPQALNALSLDMFLALKKYLALWKNDDSIDAVLIKSNNEKAFCAGGDVKSIYENKNVELAKNYFRLEYEINRLIFHYPKPYIALLNGIAMGGGLGISMHGSHCVSSENLRFAMPETLIGFFPDVGVSYHLSRLPDFIGFYLALTGNSLDATIAHQLGLIKNIVPYHHFDGLENKLIQHNLNHEKVCEIVDDFSIPNQYQPIPHKDTIKNCFSKNSVEDIFSALNNFPDPFSDEIISVLKARSPTSLKVTFEQLKKAEKIEFDEVIEMDYKIASHMLINHDFFEGVRAAIIDKDKKPKWEPSTLNAVTTEFVEKFFK